MSIYHTCCRQHMSIDLYIVVFNNISVAFYGIYKILFLFILLLNYLVFQSFDFDPYEDDARNATCGQNLISTFLYIK